MTYRAMREDIMLGKAIAEDMIVDRPMREDMMAGRATLEGFMMDRVMGEDMANIGKPKGQTTAKAMRWTPIEYQC